MNNGYIAVMDSGIGGLSTLNLLTKELPRERFLYFGDNFNAPYGEKSYTLLNILAVSNLRKIFDREVKAVLFACNTLSVNVLLNAKTLLPVPVFGVFPPVEKAVAERKKTMLFCTPKTAERYKNSEYLKVIPLKDLAHSIETNAAAPYNTDLKQHLFSSKEYRICTEEKFSPDAVILGCTHYNFIKNQFYDHFCPATIQSGDEIAVFALKNYLARSGNLANHNIFTVDFIGECAKKNEIIFNMVVKNR